MASVEQLEEKVLELKQAVQRQKTAVEDLPATEIRALRKRLKRVQRRYRSLVARTQSAPDVKAVKKPAKAQEKTEKPAQTTADKPGEKPEKAEAPPVEADEKAVDTQGQSEAPEQPKSEAVEAKPSESEARD